MRSMGITSGLRLDTGQLSHIMSFVVPESYMNGTSMTQNPRYGSAQRLTNQILHNNTNSR